MVRMPDEQERLVVAAVGESGEGKSALLNLLLNSPGEHRAFLAESSLAEACTLAPRVEEGLWRGDPCRPLTVLDTPGLGGEDARDDEVVEETAALLRQLGGAHAIIVVMRAGQSRFLGQHQQMFKLFEKVFGEEFWVNCIIDVSHSCDGRNRRNFDSWMARLASRFPRAHEEMTPKVFLDTEVLENDTLEELYTLCRGKVRMQQAEVLPKLVVPLLTSSLEDLSISLSEDLPSRRDEVPSPSLPSRAATSLALHPDTPSAVSPTPRPHSSLHGTDALPPRSPSMLLDMPPLPPPSLSPRPSRRRTLPSYSSYSSSTYSTPSTYSPSSTYSTPRLSRHRTLHSSTEDFLSTPRLPRSSLRHSYSREASPSLRSRSPSPSPPSSSSFATIGLPTYLRTCTSYGKPFTKAMRAGRLVTRHHQEGTVELVTCEGAIPALPPAQHCALLRAPWDLHLVRVARSQVATSPTLGHLEEVLLQHPHLATATAAMEGLSLTRVAAASTRVLEDDPPLHQLEAFQQGELRNGEVAVEEVHLHRLAGAIAELEEAEEVEELELAPPPPGDKAARSTEPQVLELMKMEELCLKSAYNLVKKALLPKIKYHWDQGFKQGASGWEKCPVIKLKIKYGEEEQDLLPPTLSVEGGAQCETRQVKLDGGRAKCKLRAAENKPMQLRVVPLDRAGRQEAWVPEFLFTVERITGEEVGADKWWRAGVTPAFPE